MYIDDPYALGFEAYVNNRPISDNPFQTGTDNYYAWRSGWFDGRQEELDFNDW